MKKRLLAALTALILTLTACSSNPPAQSAAGKAPTAAGKDVLQILATTYPVYLFTTAVTSGAEGVEVSLLVNAQTACLHDYTLTTTDMKAIEGADVIVMNGVGLEDFMSDALEQSKASVIDCSTGVALLPALDHEEHDPEDMDEDEYDPHIWMDPDRAAQMVENIGKGLSALDEAQAQVYQKNTFDSAFLLRNRKSTLRDGIASRQPDMQLPHRELITFHDGFQYFADAFDLTILKAIEEDEGSEASAQEIREIVSLIGEHDLPAIFTEVNGSQATAQAIARETGVEVCPLSMIMSGTDNSLSAYTDAMRENVKTILNALGEGKVRME